MRITLKTLDNICLLFEVGVHQKKCIFKFETILEAPNFVVLHITTGGSLHVCH